MQELRATRICRERDVAKVSGVTVAEPLRIPGSQCLERTLTTRTQRQHVTRPYRLARNVRTRRSLRHHDVRVRAAEPKRADAGHSPALRSLPRQLANRHCDGQPRPVDVWIGIAEVQVCRNRLMAQGQHDFEQSGKARCRFEMADVRFERAQHERRGASGAAEHGAQCADLDGITERSAGAVRLDVVDVRGRDIRGAQRFADHVLLRGAVGHGESARVSIVIDRGALNHSEHVVVIRERIRQPPEHDDDATLGAYEAVGRGIERLAAIVRREHPRLREIHVQLGMQELARAPDDGRITFAIAQALTSKMYCH